MRNANLDVLRAVAVLMVLGRYYTYSPLWARIGWAGVDLFFVLSGFLISGLLFNEFKATGAMDITRFYVRRGMKIYPAFYIMLFGTFIPTLILNGKIFTTRRAVMAECLFFQNYAKGVWGHTWSLAVEEHFYVALPILLWALRRRNARSSDPFSRLPTIFLIIAAVALTLRIWAGESQDYMHYLTPSHLRIDSLMFGVAMGYFRHFQPDKFYWMSTSPVGLAAIAVAAGTLLAFPLESRTMQTIGFSILFLGFGCLLARTVDLKCSSVWLRPLAAMGAYSYSIYLWHPYILGSIIPRLGIQSDGLGYIAYLLISVGFGVVAAKLIEVPVLAVRDRICPGYSATPSDGRSPHLAAHPVFPLPDSLT